ncbi:sensor domain-containing diguanylate cyclase [Sulfurimonas sp.]|uniref:sensor domain-containing diguanylate cyclase n=1 Tax=Sulfurimonas sp. TaxID=2022749 RepID=UPI002606F3BB|nr:sensor domain-containing diguanylate cyclase [Sulfurimonas sp.]MDD5157061.1 sensor domain-containing diguanylate cyclase [Sulfurimonas sp.]
MQKIYKFIILILLLSGGSLFLFTQFVLNYNQQINKTKNEINGLAFAQKLQFFILDIQKIRGYGQFEKEFLDDAESKLVQDEIRFVTLSIKKDINELKASQKLYPQIYDTHYNSIIEELGETLGSNQDSEIKFKKLTYIIEQLKEKMYYLGFKSELLLESDNDKYYLVDMMLKHIPSLIETVAKIRGEASRAMLENSATSELKYSLASSCSSCKDSSKQIMKILNDMNENVEKTRLIALLDGITLESQKMQEYIKQTVVSDNADLNAFEFFKVSTDVINKILEFYKTDAEFLNKRLNDKLDALETAKLKGIIIGVAVVLFIILMIFSMIRSSLLYIKSEKRIKNNLTSIINLKNSLEKCSSIQDISSTSLYFFADKFNIVQGVIYLFNEENNKLYLASSYATNKMQQIVELGEGFVGEVAVQKRHIHTLMSDSKRATGIESIIISPSSIYTVPLISYDKLFGVLQLGFIDDNNIVHNDDFKYFIDMIIGFLRDAKNSETSRKYIDLIDKYVITSKTNTKGVITDVSDAFTKITGYTKDEIIGNSHSIIRHPDTEDVIYEDMWKIIKSGKIYKGEMKNLNKANKEYWVDATITPLTDRYENILGYSAIYHDITDKKRIEEYSITDALTGLYNRRFFDITLSNELRVSKRENKNLILLMVDIDYFKQYNDTYGHLKGDEVLKAISSVMKTFFKRANDHVYRLGGEEFAVSFYSNNLKNGLDRAESLRINIGNLKIEHSTSPISKYVSISAGISFIPKECVMEMNEIYEATDKALYRAKENGRNRIEVSSVNL